MGSTRLSTFATLTQFLDARIIWKDGLQFFPPLLPPQKVQAMMAKSSPRIRFQLLTSTLATIMNPLPSLLKGVSSPESAVKDNRKVSSRKAFRAKDQPALSLLVRPFRFLTGCDLLYIVVFLLFLLFGGETILSAAFRLC